MGDWTIITDDKNLKGYAWTDDGDGQLRIRAGAGLDELQPKEYILKFTGLGSLTCNCKGYAYRSKCKHETYLRTRVKFDRTPRDIAAKYLLLLQSPFTTIPDFQIQVAGSYLRGRATVHDLDCVIVVPESAGDPMRDAAGVILACLPAVFRATIDPKSGRIIRGTLDDFQIDLYLCWPHEYGAMLLFLTGPKEWNIFMRTMAQKKGYRLSQYGLYRGDAEELVCDCTQEQPIFDALSLPYRTPEEREQFVK